MHHKLVSCKRSIDQMCHLGLKYSGVTPQGKMGIQEGSHLHASTVWHTKCIIKKITGLRNSNHDVL